jgi:hypothetical protein
LASELTRRYTTRFRFFCHVWKDVKNIKQYLMNALGFRELDMLILMDDGCHHSPTKRNIENAFRRITEYSVAGDVVFVHFSGHVRTGAFFHIFFEFCFWFAPVLPNTKSLTPSVISYFRLLFPPFAVGQGGRVRDTSGYVHHRMTRLLMGAAGQAGRQAGRQAGNQSLANE